MLQSQPGVVHCGEQAPLQVSSQQPEPPPQVPQSAGQLETFSHMLADKPWMLVGTKMDVPGTRETFAAACTALGLAPPDDDGTDTPFAVSAPTGEGVQPMLTGIWQRLAALPRDSGYVSADASGERPEEAAQAAPRRRRRPDFPEVPPHKRPER